MESARNSCFGAKLDQKAASGCKLPATFARLLSPRRLQDQCSALPKGCRAPVPARVVVVGVPLPSSGASGERVSGRGVGPARGLGSQCPQEGASKTSPHGNFHQPRTPSPSKQAEHPGALSTRASRAACPVLKGSGEPGTDSAGEKCLLSAKQAMGAGRNKKALPGCGLRSHRGTRTLDGALQASCPQQGWPDPTLPSRGCA